VLGVPVVESYMASRLFYYSNLIGAVGIKIITMGNIPNTLLPYMDKLSDEAKITLQQQYKRKQKSKGSAYALWLFLGAHYAYMGKWGMQILFWFTWGGAGLWWIIDVFRISGLIDSMNEDIAMDIFQKVKIMDK